jgi:hypothetical protein
MLADIFRLMLKGNSLAKAIQDVWHARFKNLNARLGSDDNSAVVWRLNMAAFGLGALPQMVKVFAIGGVPGAQAIMGIYLVAYVLPELLRYMAGDVRDESLAEENNLPMQPAQVSPVSTDEGGFYPFILLLLLHTLPWAVIQYQFVLEEQFLYRHAQGVSLNAISRFMSFFWILPLGCTVPFLVILVLSIPFGALYAITKLTSTKLYNLYVKMATAVMDAMGKLGDLAEDIFEACLGPKVAEAPWGVRLIACGFMVYCVVIFGKYWDAEVVIVNRFLVSLFGVLFWFCLSIGVLAVPKTWFGANHSAAGREVDGEMGAEFLLLNFACVLIYYGCFYSSQGTSRPGWTDKLG